MQENVSGFRVVKAYVKEDYEKERFGKSNDDLVNTQLNVLMIFSYMQPIMNIILNPPTMFLLKRFIMFISLMLQVVQQLLWQKPLLTIWTGKQIGS
jgi:ABC-type multidrug transport system fused ATPase/permease subunit